MPSKLIKGVLDVFEKRQTGTEEDGEQPDKPEDSYKHVRDYLNSIAPTSMKTYDIRQFKPMRDSLSTTHSTEMISSLTYMIKFNLGKLSSLEIQTIEIRNKSEQQEPLRNLSIELPPRS